MNHPNDVVIVQRAEECGSAGQGALSRVATKRNHALKAVSKRMRRLKGGKPPAIQ